MVKPGDNCMGYHPHTRIKPSHTTNAFRMRNDKPRVALSSPVVFKVGTSGSVGIVVLRHDERCKGDEVGLVDKNSKVNQFRSQDGC